MQTMPITMPITIQSYKCTKMLIVYYCASIVEHTKEYKNNA
jgi:hypothetical protein